MLLERLVRKWKSYRHRFVPWMMFNLSNNERTLRQVTEHSKDKLVPDEVVLDSLLLLARALLHKHVAELPSQIRTDYLMYCTETIHEERIYKDASVTECDIMFKMLGFCIEKRPSSMPSAGSGVFVTKGSVPKGTTVAMYPGTVYQAYEPIFIQSIRNPFVFRCIDGIFIDGNDKGISKIVYRMSFSFCPHCGTQLQSGFRFCPSCGEKIPCPVDGGPGPAVDGGPGQLSVSSSPHKPNGGGGGSSTIEISSRPPLRKTRSSVRLVHEEKLVSDDHTVAHASPAKTRKVTWNLREEMEPALESSPPPVGRQLHNSDTTYEPPSRTRTSFAGFRTRKMEP